MLRLSGWESWAARPLEAVFINDDGDGRIKTLASSGGISIR